MEHKPYGPYETYFKRPLDILCALAALIVFGWLYILVAVLVRIMLGSPVIFKQPRPGRDEKIFDLYKFRSMTDERDENGELLPDEQRLTKFGKVLRATSLDELPEAFNILKGDMSVIGPRPLLVKYLPRYSERQHRRHQLHQHEHKHSCDGAGDDESANGDAHDLARPLAAFHIGNGTGDGGKDQRHHHTEHHVDEYSAEEGDVVSPLGPEPAQQSASDHAAQQDRQKAVVFRNRFLIHKTHSFWFG